MRLRSRTAFVTGSSRGIGAAIARRLAADGAAVVLHASRNAEAAEKVAASIHAAGGQADIVLGDITEGETAARIVRDAFAVHGALDILVLNAGGSSSAGVTELTPQFVDAALALNLRPVILSTIEFARLTQSPHGRVVLISSASASLPAYRVSAYSAAKAGAEAFLRSAAQELGERGITLNSVEPALTLTHEIPAALVEKAARWTALRRAGQPEDIADVVAFLASDEARWLTGLTIPATGGQVASTTTVFACAQ